MTDLPPNLIPRKRGHQPGAPSPNAGAPIRSAHGKTKNITLSLPSGILDRIEEEARREGRSQSALVSRVLETYFQEVKIL